MSAPDPRAVFERLRARYLAARAAYDEHRTALEAKYGARFERSWLRAADRSKLERLSAAADRAGVALFAHVQAHSPRDWSTGVPAAWVRAELSWEDAVRPLGERLSVVPPLSYGSSRPKT